VSTLDRRALAALALALLLWAVSFPVTRISLAALALALLLWAVSFPVTRIALAGVLMVQMKGR